jgi:ABC-2 type transport system permease protein
MRGFMQLTWVETKLFLREWQAVFFTFLFLPMLLFLFGAIYSNDPVAMFGGFGSVDYFVPGYIAIGIASNAFFTIGGVLAAYRERGILRRFRVTPMRPVVVLLAQVLVAYLMTILSALLLMGLARVSFGLRVIGDPISMWFALTLGAISFFSFGFLVGCLPKTARASYAVNTTVFFPMIFLSGAVIPLEIMPTFMQNIAKFIPLTYVVDLLRDAWLGRGLGASWPNIAFLAALFAICTLLSAKSFRWE